MKLLHSKESFRQALSLQPSSQNWYERHKNFVSSSLLTLPNYLSDAPICFLSHTAMTLIYSWTFTLMEWSLVRLRTPLWLLLLSPMARAAPLTESWCCQLPATQCPSTWALAPRKRRATWLLHPNLLPHLEFLIDQGRPVHSHLCMSLISTASRTRMTL